MRRLIAIAALSLLAGSALAQSNPNTVQGQAFGRWRIQDKCVADATLKFPDRDLVSLQKRDGAVDQCLAAAGMPPRAHVAPTSPQPQIAPPKEDN
ncbi:MAG TPA: hypothetical protein VM689_06290 [Aliidongia sp.]|nr:hypothetical protein [Aliidongia sp.]